MNTTSEICTCLVKNATQLLQEEKDKKSSESTLQILVFMIVLMFVMIVCFLAFMVFKAPEYLAKRPKNLTRIPTIPFATGHFIELLKDYKDLTPDARILMNTTTEICNCLVKNATQLLQEEEDKRRSEAHFQQLYFLFGLVYLVSLGVVRPG
ncbi:hypothetical protein CAEBREN_22167 [Caenorhabditis brenneri]|uniref:Uncharacterized protein n=1 Tax=Caenorhabditis brenneri TaxID=135651 RepID=G0MJQ0_CAEBE|nr:hypothetical protein CAEBREN_22167 [Caenorhabditis brenneri]